MNWTKYVSTGVVICEPSSQCQCVLDASLSGDLSLLGLFKHPLEVCSCSADWWLGISPWQGVPLFDGSSNFIDPQTLQSLQQCQLLLSNLSTVLNCFLTEARELTEKGWWKHCWAFSLFVKIWKDAWVVTVETGAVVVLDAWERGRLSRKVKLKSEQLGLWFRRLWDQGSSLLRSSWGWVEEAALIQQWAEWAPGWQLQQLSVVMLRNVPNC